MRFKCISRSKRGCKRGGRHILLPLMCGLLFACTVEGPGVPSSGSSNSGVTMRDVVGDFCPPAQAMKGNC